MFSHVDVPPRERVRQRAGHACWRTAPPAPAHQGAFFGFGPLFTRDGGPSCHDIFGSRAVDSGCVAFYREAFLGQWGFLARASSALGVCDDFLFVFASYSRGAWGPPRRALSCIPSFTLTLVQPAPPTRA